MITNNQWWRKAINNHREYRSIVIKATISEMSAIDKRLEDAISEALNVTDLKSITDLITLRRPIAVGRMEGIRLAKANGIPLDDFVEQIGNAIDAHANKYWDGVTV